MNNFLLPDAKDAVSYIKSIFKSEIPKVAVILGSGLGDFTKIVKIIHSIPYKEIPGFPHNNSEVQGHKGNLTLAMVDNGKEILILEGRFHYYQGYTPQQVVLPIIVLHLLGVDTLIISNAAGGCNPHFKEGDLMIINDHINLTGNHPLIGDNDANYGPRFLDQTQPYNQELIEKAKEVAKKLDMQLQEGVYISVTGPTYETKAEVRMCQILGADAVGMSTVYEVIMANYFKMKVLAISTITNMATGLSKAKHSHQNIIDSANLISAKFSNLVKQIIKKC